MRLLQMFRQSALCPKVKENKNNGQLMIENSYHSSNYYPSQSVQRQEYQESNPYQTKLEPPQDGTQYIQPLFDVPRIPLPPQPYMFPEYFPNQPQNMIYGNSQNPMPPPSFQANPVPVRNIYNQEAWPFLVHKFTSFEYIQCVCEGKYGNEKNQGFKCQNCNYSYHYNCLRIDKINKEQILCPMCTLRKETIFCGVVKEPIKYNWYLHEKNNNSFNFQMSLE